jgi:hypothetical protein
MLPAGAGEPFRIRAAILKLLYVQKVQGSMNWLGGNERFKFGEAWRYNKARYELKFCCSVCL